VAKYRLGFRVYECGCGCNRTYADLIDKEAESVLSEKVSFVSTAIFNDSPAVREAWEETLKAIVTAVAEKISGRPVKPGPWNKQAAVNDN
jgi:hypothetical protein